MNTHETKQLAPTFNLLKSTRSFILALASLWLLWKICGILFSEVLLLRLFISGHPTIHLSGIIRQSQHRDASINIWRLLCRTPPPSWNDVTAWVGPTALAFLLGQPWGAWLKGNSIMVLISNTLDQQAIFQQSVMTWWTHTICCCVAWICCIQMHCIQRIARVCWIQTSKVTSKSCKQECFLLQFYQHVTLISNFHNLNFLWAGLPPDFGNRDFRPPADVPCVVERLCYKHQGVVCLLVLLFVNLPSWSKVLEALCKTTSKNTHL